MEGLNNKMLRKGKTFDTDESLRMKRNPNGHGSGQLAEDLGTSGFALQSSQRSRSSSVLSREDQERVKRAKPPIDISDSDEEEADEIDFLSSAAGSDDELTQERETPSHLSAAPFSQDRLQSTSGALKSLRFRKNNSENHNAVSTRTREPATGVLEPKSPNLSNTPRPSSSFLSKPLKSSSRSRLAAKSKVTTKIGSEGDGHGGSGYIDSESSVLDAPDPKGKSRAKGKEKALEKKPLHPVLQKERPRPKAIPKPSAKPLPASPSATASLDSSILFKNPVGGKPLRAATPPETVKRKASHTSKPASFPLAASLSPEHTPKQFPQPVPSKAAGFPVVKSPENTPKRPANRPPLSAFPLSPNESQERSFFGGDRSTLQSPGKKATSKKKKGARSTPAPFPLNSPQGAGSSHRNSAKRVSNRSSDEDDTPSKKRRRDSNLLSSSPPDDLSDDDDLDDNYFYDPSVDASTLCPYCDEPLPPSPTPRLQHLLITIAKKSVPEPRSTNPLGRKAAVGLFINVCQRHRFESKSLPEAEAKGWPKSIEWGLIHERVMKMKDHLEAILENSVFGNAKKSGYGEEGEDDSDSEEDSNWQIRGQSSKKLSSKKLCSSSRARDLCVFWSEAMEEVKIRGTRGAANVKNQFANFEKAQPGYYGELGSILIHQTLYKLFPPESTSPELVSPLSPKQFIERVLLPEVAVRLIMEDKSLNGVSGARKALDILRESTSYGVAMFPDDIGERVEGSSGTGKVRKKKGQERGFSEAVDDDEDSLDLSVADQMVRETARRRRLELEKEEEQEQAELMQEEEEQKRAMRKTRETRSRNGRLEKSTAPIHVSSPQKPKPKPRPKPKAVSGRPNASSHPDAEVDSESEASGSDARSKMLAAQSDDDARMSSDHDLDDMNNMHIDVRDDGEAGEIGRSIQCLDSGNDSDRSMRTAPSSFDQRITRGRKGKERQVDVSPERSPSLEILSHPPSPSSSFDKDATPRGSGSRTAFFPAKSSASMKAGSHLGLDNWSNDPNAAPLDYLKRRNVDSQTNRTATKIMTTRSSRRNAVQGLNEDTADTATMSTDRKGKKTSRMIGRTASETSDPGWLLDDSSQEYL
ncbi:hypothetical protein D9757_007517 [Collybiopsis confluens]|uniref:Restriction of telomere capping protein 4 n=1 Tax=Collybiopsis confluens TaxID=2823264 RepID=A0A8H5M8C7_9AGAR|nr:hypothetical protein D9757_007517 [Collybiopsis confluens]